VVDISDFPVELRWKIAARSGSTVSLAQEKIFKEILGKDYQKVQPLTDTINYLLWIQNGKDASVLSNYLGLPTKTAEEIDKAQELISIILYGPEIKYKPTYTSKDQVKTQITSCPFQNRARELGLETKNLFENCKAYNKSFIDNLNPKYTQRFISAMCKGDPYCETHIELRNKY
jgi:hypothetical protein